MRIAKCQCIHRPGTIALLAAFFMIFIIGMVAFAVDVSWMVSTETELQNAADAGALAAISQLPDYYVQYHLPNITSAQKDTILANAYAAARTAAKNCVSYNSAGGVTSLNLDTTNDVTFSYTTDGTTFSNTYTFPNTVSVTTRRDASNANTNGSLNLFFAPVIGTTTSNLRAAATATMYGGTLNSLKAKTGILPMTYDAAFWNSFLATGKDPDGNVTIGPDGLPQLVVYPIDNYKGNFGELSLNDAHNGASTSRAWIEDGLSQADVDDLKDSNLIPLSAHNPKLWDWRGNPGFKSSVVQEVNDHYGETFVLPLFKAFNSDPDDYQAGDGQGSHYDYNIVKFVGIKIVSTGNRTVIVQPAAATEIDTLFSSVAPVANGSSGSVITTFGVPKLTR